LKFNLFHQFIQISEELLMVWWKLSTVRIRHSLSHHIYQTISFNFNEHYSSWGKCVQHKQQWKIYENEFKKNVSKALNRKLPFGALIFTHFSHFPVWCKFFNSWWAEKFPFLTEFYGKYFIFACHLQFGNIVASIIHRISFVNKGTYIYSVMLKNFSHV
jgi:hypothetical protein